MGFEVGGGKKAGAVKPSINVTPLVDVVLVLLIIFLVVTPMLTKAFSIQVPPQETKVTAEPNPEDQVVLRLDAAGNVTLNSEPIAIGDIELRLRRIFAARANDVVFFDAAWNAPYGTAVRVMDIARGAGASTIGIVTEALVPETPPSK